MLRAELQRGDGGGFQEAVDPGLARFAGQRNGERAHLVPGGLPQRQQV